MKNKFKFIPLVVAMLVLSLVIGNVVPLVAPAEGSVVTTLNGQTVTTRRVGTVAGRGGVELAEAASLATALRHTSVAAVVGITPGTMLVQHGSREMFILAGSRTAFLTTGIGTRTPSTTSVNLSAAPQTVAARELLVPFADVVRHLQGEFTAARVATLRTAAPVAAFDFTANPRNVVNGTEIRMVGRGATFPDTLYGRTVTPGPGGAIPAGTAPWLPLFFNASEDLSGDDPHSRIGYNRINLTGGNLAEPTDNLPLAVYAPHALRGSGVGVDAVRLRAADFGGTDMISLVPAHVLEAFPAIPTVKGGVSVIFNVYDNNNHRIRHLNLTADAIARIYLGQITRWNDAALVRLNPGVALPNHPIQVNWRPEVSGTTEIFTAYLNAASPVWRAALTPAQRTTVDIDGPGVAGVVYAGVGGWTTADFTDSQRTQQAHATGGGALEGRVLGAANSIGYISYGDVVTEFNDNRVGVARVQNRAGIFVLPLVANVYAAGIGHGNVLTHPINGANPGAYPITGLTWIMVERDAAIAKPQGDSVQIAGTDTHITAQPVLSGTALDTQRRRAAVVVDFIRWAVVEGFGDAEARRLHMAPLTPAMKREVARLLGTIQVGN